MFLSQSEDAHQVTLQALRDARCLDVKMLFINLSAPPMNVLSGEYRAELLDQGSWLANRLIGLAFLLRGNWVGKGFRPQDAKTGVGYNCFTQRGSQIQKLPMRTELRLSEIDDRESLTINYRQDNRGLIRWLTGEVRQISPHIMLGIGIYQIKIGRITLKRRLIPFLLHEPHRESHKESSPNPMQHSTPKQVAPRSPRAPRKEAALGSV